MGHQSNFVPDYEVLGGLVLVEVNEDLIRTWQRVPPAVSIERYQYRKTGTAENDRMLMVVNVLPDKINLGYEQFLLELYALLIMLPSPIYNKYASS